MELAEDDLVDEADEAVMEDEKESAGVATGVEFAALLWLNFRDMASASASAARYAWAERPLSEEVDDFLRPWTGDCIGEGIFALVLIVVDFWLLLLLSTVVTTQTEKVNSISSALKLASTPSRARPPTKRC